MTSDVVLTAALRNNLLSLQSTQSLIDTTQFRLATGRKVNSALDSPQAFFAAQALNNRAGDLTRLLDGIGQSIQVIKAADNGITALTKLVEQADSIAQSARDTIAQGEVQAKVVASRDVRGIDDLTTLPGVTDGDTITIGLTDENGLAVNIGTFSTAPASAAATATITINTNDSIEDIINEINNLQIDDGTGIAAGGQAFEASLDESGRLQIRTLNGGDFTANFDGGGTAAGNDAQNFALATDLGFGDIARLVADGGGSASNNVEFSAVAAVSLISFTLYDNAVPPQIAQASTTLNNIRDESGAISRFLGLDASSDDYLIGINGGSQQSINLTDAAGNPLTIQHFVDQINANASLNTKIQAAYDATTGQVTIRPIDSTVDSIEIGVSGSAQTANFGFGINTNLASTGAGGPEVETIRLAAAAASLAQFEGDFNRIRDQIDLLVQDTGYRGTNLLLGDDLLTNFNEFRTSSLTTQSVTFTADGLGLDEANFARIDSIDGSLAQVREALEAVRNFGSTLSNDLAVIQAREGYTKDIVNTLKEGSERLTIADQNEEGAKLLALQTRQQLGVTSLSLASQSQQSILRLF